MPCMCCNFFWFNINRTVLCLGCYSLDLLQLKSSMFECYRWMAVLVTTYWITTKCYYPFPRQWSVALILQNLFPFCYRSVLDEFKEKFYNIGVQLGFNSFYSGPFDAESKSSIEADSRISRHQLLALIFFSNWTIFCRDQLKILTSNFCYNFTLLKCGTFGRVVATVTRSQSRKEILEWSHYCKLNFLHEIVTWVQRVSSRHVFFEHWSTDDTDSFLKMRLGITQFFNKYFIVFGVLFTLSEYVQQFQPISQQRR